MSAIYLIRHGQANSTGEDYDLLTDKGKEQAFALGKYMASNGDFPDKIISGTMRRHKETAEFFMKGVSSVRSDLETGSDFHSFDPNWNEFPSELWKKYAEHLSAVRPEFQRSLLQFSKVRLKGGVRSAALFFKLTEEILSVWRKGDFTPEGIETFVDFQSRVDLACDTYFQPSDAERLFIFTSGTPISLTLKKMLRQDEDVFAWMPWIWNSSVSMFRWVRGRYIPVSLNFLPHIPDKSARTLY
ncbi:histidine phosphatase family protein [Leptospira hartskeerlii]|uniref:Histidine phosphatase family protein n=1 Tax=Leptospira hartskeerlii TaxID=2023177 RepID=A0A2M9XC82_9LEPT|nr:histidine phosphatase family protein [Leptospira hartskeerlii]PJZ25274.1 histidine phosphatase family protein [Leptospira hartskeerlii]PJZ32745.1 histidine phosphatase family protein [Leptospira hartskeerlii]